MDCGIRFFLSCWAICIIGLLSSAETPPNYGIVDLGEGWARSINDKGQVVSHAESPDLAAFIWDSTSGRRGIPRYPEAPKEAGQQPFRINNQGKVLISISEIPAPVRIRSVTRQAGGPPPMRAGGAPKVWTLIWTEEDGYIEPEPFRGEKIRIHRMNDRGEMIAATNAAPQLLITATGTAEIQEVDPDLKMLVDLNNLGVWLGVLKSTDPLTNSPRLNRILKPHFDEQHFFFALSDRSDLLYRYPDPDYSNLHGIALLTVDGEVIELETLSTEIETTAINSRREIVGNAYPLTFSEWLEIRGLGIDQEWFWDWASAFDKDTERFAALWIDGRMYDLNGLIPKDSGWGRLERAEDINERGQIVGRGVRDGKNHAFLLNPVEE